MEYSSILSMDPTRLLEWLLQNFTVNLPEEIISVEDMNNASKLLLKLTSYYSYMNSLLSAAKIAKRKSKRNATTEEYQNMVDRTEIIQNMVDVIKQQYAAVSRAVTIHIDNNNELRMNASGMLR